MAGAKYLAADTVGIPLHTDPSGRLWGADRKEFTLGPWALDVWVEVHSDFVGDKEVGLWMSVTDRLWLYFVVGFTWTWMVVIDAKVMGLNHTTREQFSLGEAKLTLAGIKRGVVAAYEYHDFGGGSSEWARIPNTVLDFGQPK